MALSDVERPTLMVAAGGPKMLELAARSSDIVMVTVPVNQRLGGSKPSLKVLEEQIAHVRNANPDNPPQIQLQIRNYFPEGLPSDNLWELNGSPSAIEERLSVLGGLGVSYLSLCTNSVASMEKFAKDLI
jgi:hypothetical protein